MSMSSEDDEIRRQEALQCAADIGHGSGELPSVTLARAAAFAEYLETGAVPETEGAVATVRELAPPNWKTELGL